MARWRPNVFFDMSGGETIEEHGERRGYIAGDIGVEKLVWGSDCPAEHVQEHVERFGPEHPFSRNPSTFKSEFKRAPCAL